jgi:FixJ family two-component response regulator
MDASPVIYVVDDDRSFRTATGRMLRASGYQVALYETSQQLLNDPPASPIGCILLDVQMSGLTGPQLQERLVEGGNCLPIVFLTGHADIPTTVRTIKAGAEDFLTKPVAPADLLATLKRAIAHGADLRAKAERIDSSRALVKRLTPREKEVFFLLVRGLLNKQIAHELGTSVRTIKAHRQGVMQKCAVRSVAELVLIAQRAEFRSDIEISPLETGRQPPSTERPNSNIRHRALDAVGAK